MTVDELKDVLDALINMYKDMEKEYGINLTREKNHVKTVIDDIPEAIRKAEHK